MTLDALLDQLEVAQLVRRASEPEPTFLFKNALTQETAYLSLLVRRRHDIHREVAAAYEATYADQLDDYSPLLAYHYGAAGDERRTRDYAQRAGDRAARQYAYAEAVAFYRQALDLALRTDASADQLEHIFLGLGRMLQFRAEYDQAITLYGEMERLARERKDPHLELAGLMAEATIHSSPTARYDEARGYALSQQALALAKEHQDPAAESKILWNLSLLSYFEFKYPEAVRYGEQSLVLARELGLQEQLAFTLSDLARTFYVLGNWEKAQADAAEARDLWRALGNLAMLADSLGAEAEAWFIGGESSRTLSIGNEALEINQRIGNVWGQAYVEMVMAQVYVEQGQFDQAISTLKRTMRLADDAGFIFGSSGARTSLALVYAWMGAFPMALELFEEVMQRTHGRYAPMAPRLRTLKAGALLWKGDLEGARSEIATARVEDLDQPFSSPMEYYTRRFWVELDLESGDLARASQEAVKILNGLRQFGVRTFEPEALLLQARIKHSERDLAGAATLLTEAIDKSRALPVRRILWDALREAAEVEMERGNLEAADQLRNQAREEIDFLLGNIPIEFQEGFLRLPRVKWILEDARLLKPRTGGS